MITVMGALYPMSSSAGFATLMIREALFRRALG